MKICNLYICSMDTFLKMTCNHLYVTIVYTVCGLLFFEKSVLRVVAKSVLKSGQSNAFTSRNLSGSLIYAWLNASALKFENTPPHKTNNFTESSLLAIQAYT